MTEHQVLIIGGGPTGLMLAAELALAGVDAAIVERRVNQELAGSRAGGLLPRTIEELDQRGVADRFVSQGQKHAVVMFPGTVLDASDLPTRHAYWLGLWQAQIERILAEWVLDLGVQTYRSAEATGFVQDDTGVSMTLDDGRVMRARYLVGCDGGRSLVRKQAGIDFPGWDASLSYLIFEGKMRDEPPAGVRHAEKGVIAIGKIDDGARVRGVVTEPALERGDQPSEAELRGALQAAYGTDFGVHDVTWLSRFTDAARQAASYRERRVLLAGDAAHIHSPTGGQGLNIGMQDAVNLGWKLAQVVRGVSPESLLDTYHAERHPVAARVLKHTLAITALSRGDDRTNALRETLPHVMQMDEPRKWYCAMMAGLNIRYDLGDAHPLVGRRMPDLELTAPDGPVRVFALLHDARPLLLNLSGEAFAFARRPERVKVFDARYGEALQLPALGEVAAPEAILMRPDGYVAWAGDVAEASLIEALAAWFGPVADA